MNKKGLLIIGAGGVSTVATLKCAMNIDTFEKITLASRTISKCKKIQKYIKEKIDVNINITAIDADNVPKLIQLIQKENPKIVLNVGLLISEISYDATPEKPSIT